MQKNSALKKTKYNLIIKIILVSAPVFLAFLFFVGNLSEKILVEQILENTDELLYNMSKREAVKIDKYFKEIEKLGLQSSEIIKKWIKNKSSDKNFNKKYIFKDGALRSNISKEDRDISGVFLSNRTKLNDEIKNIISSTEFKFEEYAKGTQPFVFNMYLITKHQLIRIYPNDWALEIEANHDFRTDIFYYISDPENNKERKPKWTDPYYDSIWKRWMISLITPIYIDDEFLGIVGHDVILDEIYDDVLNSKYYNSGFGFVFDENRNIVVHPKYLEQLQKSAEMGDLLSSTKFGDNLLKKLMNDIVKEGISESGNKKIYLFEGKKHFIYTSKLKMLNWYYSIDVTEEEFLSTLPEFRSNFILLAVVGNTILFISVVLIVWFFIIKPIRKLQKAAENVIVGDYKQIVEVNSKDEIGNLSSTFNSMINEINQKISEINKAKDKYKGILENSVEGIFQSSIDGSFISINSSGAKILGYDDEKDVLTSITDIENQLYVNKEDRLSFINSYESTDRINHVEIEIYKKDRSKIWVEIRERAILDNEGKLKYFEGFFNDVTERRRSEEILKLKNTILKTQQETSPDGILIVDQNLKTVDYNRRFLEMWDIPETIMKTRSDDEARNYVRSKLVDPEKFEEKIMQLYNNPDKEDLDIVELKGHIFFERFTAPLVSSDNEILGRIWQFRDITEQIKADKELIEAKEKAELSDKLKSEFLAQVSHEIRTPINAVLSFSQLLKVELEDEVEKDLRDGFVSIDNAGRRIIRTIDLILNMSEIQSGAYDYVSRSINIYDEVITVIFDEYKHIAFEKNLELNIIKNTENLIVEADEYTVAQIVANLLDNAIKYTNEGKIDIVLARDSDGLILEFSDTGIGISEEYLPSLFKEFSQEEQGYTRKYEGNGLGLALVKKYCELNNAEISVESQKNIGTTFRIKFKS